MRKFVRRVVAVGIGVALGAGVLAAQQAKVSGRGGLGEASRRRLDDRGSVRLGQ